MKLLRISRIGMLLLFAVSLSIALFDLDHSGPIWPDAPRYASGGAMIYDWLASGEFSAPYQFAKANYAQYPAFNIPYHPPLYPGLLGVFFQIAGLSYGSARLFIGLCLWGCACAFAALLKETGVRPVGALLGALLLITMPEVVLWSRDTMAETPALFFILSASFFFVRWLNTDRTLFLWMSLALAEMAFLSKVTIIIIPFAWLLTALLTRKWKDLLALRFISPILLFFALNTVWVYFVSQFSEDAAKPALTFRWLEYVSWQFMSHYPSLLPNMAGWGVLLLSVVGAVFVVTSLRKNNYFIYTSFWALWFLSNYIFCFIFSALPDQRYFYFALPALPAFAAALFLVQMPRHIPKWIVPITMAIALLFNITRIPQVPMGLVGYATVGEKLASLEKPGNILLACRQLQELIFRYRAAAPRIERALLRADRTLAIRVGEWANVWTNVPPKLLAESDEDVLAVIERGRVRYLVTQDVPHGGNDRRDAEMMLAHTVAQSHPELFTLVGTYPLRYHLGHPAETSDVYVWEYQPELPAGPHELPVIIPTANLKVTVQ